MSTPPEQSSPDARRAATGWEREQEYQAVRRFIRLSLGENEPARMVAHAVRMELTPRQRELVTLYYVEQLTQKQVAERTGLAPSTVSRTIKRARVRLRRYLRYGGRTLMRALDEDV